MLAVRATIPATDFICCAVQDCVPPDMDSPEEMGSRELCGHLRELCQMVEQTLPSLEDRQRYTCTCSWARGKSCQCPLLSTSGEEPSPSKTPPCSSCEQLQSEMDSVLATLNSRSTARYGDVLRQNLTLQQQVELMLPTLLCVRLCSLQVASQRRELSRGEEQFHKLSLYLQEYQSNSSQKVRTDSQASREIRLPCETIAHSLHGLNRSRWCVQVAVLKENLLKADREVAELDQLVEQVRQVGSASPAIFLHYS